MDWETPVLNSPLRVKFPEGIEAKNGNKLIRAQAAVEPSISWNADPNKLYLLAMMDPDAPFYYFPIFGEVVHWLVGNIRGGNIKGGDEVAAYRGPGPAPGTGVHRYVFLVFEQLGGKITFDEVEQQMKTSRVARVRYSIKDIQMKYNLGEPVAKNYFTASFFE